MSGKEFPVWTNHHLAHPGKPALTLYFIGAAFCFGSLIYMGDVVVGLMIGGVFAIAGYVYERVNAT